LIRDDQAIGRVPPAHERFDAADRRRADIHLGLVEIDEFLFLQGASELIGAIDRPRRAGQVWHPCMVLLDQGCELTRVHRLLKRTQHIELMRLRQTLSGLQHACVFAADEQQPAAEPCMRQMPEHFNAVHVGHLQIANDHVRCGVSGLQRLQGIPAVLKSAHFLVACIAQLALQDA